MFSKRRIYPDAGGCHMVVAGATAPHVLNRRHQVTDIWQPITLGGVELPNRFVMAPMTRSRADFDGTPARWPPNITRSAPVSG